MKKGMQTRGEEDDGGGVAVASRHRHTRDETLMESTSHDTRGLANQVTVDLVTGPDGGKGMS